jgi:hypothetical protein
VTVAEWAETYAQRGWLIFPVNEKNKQPLISQYEATSNVDQIRSWWGQWPNASIGYRVAEDELLIDVDPRHGGDSTWKALRSTFGDLPPTRKHRSGRGDGGGHVWFKRPSDLIVSTGLLDKWAQEHQTGVRVNQRWTSGLDVLQHNHRYSILPPSLHAESGKPYEWLSEDVEPAECPLWLVDLLRKPDRLPDPPKPLEQLLEVSSGHDSIADWLCTHYTWNEILEPHGWYVVRGDGDQDGSAWLHPGSTSGAEHSATIRFETLFVHSTSTVFEPTAPGDPRGYTRFRAWAVLNHGGDLSEAARAARTLRFGEPIDTPFVETPSLIPAAPVEQSDYQWKILNLNDVKDFPPEPPPSVGMRTDDFVHLLYEGKVHTIYGEPGGMKSWFTQVIAAQVVEGGDRVLIIDFENTPRSVYDRFICLGLGEEEISLIHAIQPEQAFSAEDRKMIEQAAAEHRYKLIVVDGTTDAMVMFGLEPEKNADAAKFDKGFLKPLAQTGAAVIYVDHVAKSTESRGTWSFGAQHKKSAIDGASFGVEMLSSFGEGMTGRAKILIHKDKVGKLFKWSVDGAHSTIVDLNMNSDPDTYRITYEMLNPCNGEAHPRRPWLMSRIYESVRLNPGLSKDLIIEAAHLESKSRDWVYYAFEDLRIDGYLECDLGDPRNPTWRPTTKVYDSFQDGLDHDRPVVMTPEKEESIARINRKVNRGWDPFEEPSGVAVGDLL